MCFLNIGKLFISIYLHPSRHMTLATEEGSLHTFILTSLHILPTPALQTPTTSRPQNPLSAHRSNHTLPIHHSDATQHTIPSCSLVPVCCRFFLLYAHPEPYAGNHCAYFVFPSTYSLPKPFHAPLALSHAPSRLHSALPLQPQHQVDFLSPHTHTHTTIWFCPNHTHAHHLRTCTTHHPYQFTYSTHSMQCATALHTHTGLCISLCKVRPQKTSVRPRKSWSDPSSTFS